MKCRHCHAPLNLSMIDLGEAPPSNAYLTAGQLTKPEQYYALRVKVCTECWLAQTEDYASSGELFSEDYAYYSSFSSSWLAHARDYVGKMIERFALTDESHVVEIASNDGYLLQYVKAAGISCLGVEPTRGTAEAARKLGIEVVEEFFGVDTAKSILSSMRGADLMAANNVLAHVPDINDFVGGFAILLSPRGVATFEFPHLLELMVNRQFDTIYHEHYSYLSLTSVETIFKANGLSIFDVELLPTHGGSLRVYAQRSDTGKHAKTERVESLRTRELRAGMKTSDFYLTLQPAAEAIKLDLLRFLRDAAANGRTVAAYGAAAKGNTLLNFAGVGASQIDFVVDRNPFKQNMYMPGSHIPIVNEDVLKESKPDYVLLLPWNLRTELETQLGYVRHWGAKIVTAIPSLEIR